MLGDGQYGDWQIGVSNLTSDVSSAVVNFPALGLYQYRYVAQLSGSVQELGSYEVDISPGSVTGTPYFAMKYSQVLLFVSLVSYNILCVFDPVVMCWLPGGIT